MSLESPFICLLIDALFVMIISVGVCRVSKLGAMSKKLKVAKFDLIVRRWYIYIYIYIYIYATFCVRSVMRSCLTEIRRNKSSC